MTWRTCAIYPSCTYITHQKEHLSLGVLPFWLESFGTIHFSGRFQLYPEFPRKKCKMNLLMHIRNATFKKGVRTCISIRNFVYSGGSRASALSPTYFWDEIHIWILFFSFFVYRLLFYRIGTTKRNEKRKKSVPRCSIRRGWKRISLASANDSTIRTKQNVFDIMKMTNSFC